MLLGQLGGADGPPVRAERGGSLPVFAPDRQSATRLAALLPELDADGRVSIDLVGKSANFVETLRGVRDTLPADLSYPLESCVGGIIMWGVNEDGDLCFWISETGDPEQWRVGVYSRNFNGWTECPCGFAEFLVGVVNGKIESPFSRADFPPVSCSFKTWRAYLDELLDED